MADEINWRSIADESFRASTSYMDANYRKTLERNIALFQSRHPAGSKYNSQAYKTRSRLFRPKTKSVVRKNEAAAVAAFFSNVDVISAEPENDGDVIQVAGADLMNELMNYRLTQTVPWFMTVVGAMQDAQVQGIVASYQYWDYKEEPGEPIPVTDDAGEPLTDETGAQYVQEGDPIIVEDKPCIELTPLENILFDPGAKWTDVVNSSPYVIRKVPMYVDDVKTRMENPGRATPWKTYTEQEIRAAMVEYDSIRQAREGVKQDPLADNNAPMKEFEIVWCHENFVRLKGKEYVYWTLGTQKLLTDPVPLKEAYFHGQRPIVIGYAVLEAHKAVPDSLVAIGSDLQKEVNETVNQRRDNVSLVLNKRWFVRRGKGVDVESLIRNAAGGVTMMDDPEKDVIGQEFNDVTGSSYQEQDRLNVDFDELTGNFSQGSIQTNRKLNETVGGMQMMGGAASQMTEYLIRTVVETWMEKVLNQLALLEREYETNATILQVCGGKAKIAEKYGIPPDFDLLKAPISIRVNVGMGATDPKQKMAKFTFALQSYGMAMQIPGADPEAIRREVFGLAGYKDGSRFFVKQDDPQVMQLQQQLQMAMGQLQQVSQELESVKLDKTAQVIKAQADQQKADTDARKAEVEADEKRAQAEREAKKTDADIDLVEAQTLKTLAEAGSTPSEETEAAGTETQSETSMLTDAIERMAEMHGKSAQAIEKAIENMNKPKRIVTDADGNPIGTETVEEGSIAPVLEKLTAAVSKLSKPKRLVMDKDGNPIGVE